MQPTSNNSPKRKPRRRFSLKKTLRLFLPPILFISLCVVMCTPTRHSESDGAAIVTTTKASSDETAPDAGINEEVKPISEEIPTDVHNLETDTVSSHLAHLDEMPEPTERIKVNYFGNMHQFFNDSNYIHWQEAEIIGIEPLTDTRSHWQLKEPIVQVTSCENFFIDSLIYSRPYLVPIAAARLHEIGHRFRDSIASRGGGDYRIKVTSLLRTPRTVKRLRRRNRNAIDSSVHQLATTFDISYASFIADNSDNPRSVDDLKGILGEVLKAMREEGKLWVKYERGQPCFHITARKKQPHEASKDN